MGKLWKITLPALNPLLSLMLFSLLLCNRCFHKSIISKIRKDMPVEYGFSYAAAEAWIYFLVLVLVLGIYVLIFIRKPKRKVRIK